MYSPNVTFSSLYIIKVIEALDSKGSSVIDVEMEESKHPNSISTNMLSLHI